MTYKEMLTEVDLLKGCINRICVSNDLEEISMLYGSARTRLINITTHNIYRVANVRMSEQTEESKT